jgi:hypothetical protein
LGTQNPALETQIQPWRLKSSSGGSNTALEAQIQLWRLKSSYNKQNKARTGAITYIHETCARKHNNMFV